MQGHVRKRGNKWCFVVNLGRDPVTKKRKQKWYSGYKTKKEAQKALTEVLQKINTNTYADSKNMTVKEYLYKWLQDYALHNVAPKTYRSYKDTVELHLIPKLGNYKLEKLNPSIVQSYYTWCINETDLSSTSILYNHKVLRQALNHAVKWQLISINSCNAVEPPKKNNPKIQVLNEKEIEKLLNACKGKQIYLPIFLAITTGMRRGEIAGLKWDDVDFDREKIYIKHALQRVNGSLELVPTKTEKSQRSIALLSSVVPVLKQYYKRYKENKLLLGEKFQDSGFVCAWDDGRPCTPDYITNQFIKIRDKLDITKVRFHDLRHTHATLLLKEGINPKIVQERLGHSNISTTMDIYSHVTESMQREAAQKLDKSLFKKAK